MKKLFNKKFLWLVPLALIMAGCKQQSTAIVPPKIRYGLETCADCGMIINDPHYAAAIAFRAKPDAPMQTKVFDDIGCMLSWEKHHEEDQTAKIWVKDVNTAVWLHASSAVYLQSDKLSTPMGSGVVAGTTASDFSKLAVHTPILKWTNLLNADPMKTERLAAANTEPLDH